MKSLKLKTLLSAVGMSALLMATMPVKAGTVPMSEVVQEINAKPAKSGGNAAKLRLAGGDTKADGTGDETAAGQPVPSATPQGRVYTVEEVDVIKDEDCDCVQPAKKRKFPYWAFLGLAAVPFAFCCRGKDKPPPSNTPPTTPPETPPPGTTPPPNTPVPEPMTLLLFGTGLAGVGLAARRRFRKNETGDDKPEIQ